MPLTPTQQSLIKHGTLVAILSMPYVILITKDIIRGIRTKKERTLRTVQRYEQHLPLIAECTVLDELGEPVPNIYRELIMDPQSRQYKLADQYLRKHPDKAEQLDEILTELIKDHKRRLTR